MSVDKSEVQKDQTRPRGFLFTPERDLSKACPCGECGSKIAKLKEFEIDIIPKRELIRRHIGGVENKVFLLLKLSSAAECPKRMLDVFHKKLKAVSQKAGDKLTLTKSSSADNLGDMVLTIYQMLKNCGLPVNDDDDDDDDDDDEYEYDSYDVFAEIKRGRFYYLHTKYEDAAYCLFQEIETNEKNYDIMRDPSASKKHIEKQVELVKKFPVEKLKLEVEELTGDVVSIETHQEMYVKAKDCISHTCFDMISIRDEFWKGAPKGNEHISNGVNKTFDALLTKATLFEDSWKEYATFFTRDRANPKRQRT